MLNWKPFISRSNENNFPKLYTCYFSIFKLTRYQWEDQSETGELEWQGLKGQYALRIAQPIGCTLDECMSNLVSKLRFLNI